MGERNIVCLKYIAGTASKTEVVPVPLGIKVDLTTDLWWPTTEGAWSSRFQIGRHQLYHEQEEKRYLITQGVPGAVIGIYDVSDPVQARALKRDAKEALKRIIIVEKK
jgi:hypothetical protein